MALDGLGEVATVRESSEVAQIRATAAAEMAEAARTLAETGEARVADLAGEEVARLEVSAGLVESQRHEIERLAADADDLWGAAAGAGADA